MASSLWQIYCLFEELLMISPKIKQFLSSYGAATNKRSLSTKVNGANNERFYGPLWRTIRLLMADAQPKPKPWHLYLPIALQALRALLNLKTNAIPRMALIKNEGHSTHGLLK